MRRVLFGAAVIVGVLAVGRPLRSVTPYETAFTGDTMRVDYLQTGGRGIEAVALDHIVNDGPWPGSRTDLLDGTNLGKYLFEVIDRGTNRLIYSRGFANLYGEWETTPEAREINRTFSGSLRFPWPKAPVQVVLEEAGSTERFSRVLVHHHRSGVAAGEPGAPGAGRPGVDAVGERTGRDERRSPAHR